MDLAEPHFGIGHPLLCREAEHPFDLRADIRPRPRRSRFGDVHDRGNSLHQEPVSLLGTAQLALQPFALRDVLRHADHVVRVPVRVPHQGSRQVHPQDAAVLADEALLHLEMVDLSGSHLGKQIKIGLKVAGVGELRKGHRGELLGGIAQRATQYLVGHARAAFEVDDADTDRSQLDDCLQASDSVRRACRRPGNVSRLRLSAVGAVHAVPFLRGPHSPEQEYDEGRRSSSGLSTLARSWESVLVCWRHLSEIEEAAWHHTPGAAHRWWPARSAISLQSWSTSSCWSW